MPLCEKAVRRVCVRLEGGEADTLVFRVPLTSSCMSSCTVCWYVRLRVQGRRAKSLVR
jgi:hypothetical protein